MSCQQVCVLILADSLSLSPDLRCQHHSTNLLLPYHLSRSQLVFLLVTFIFMKASVSTFTSCSNILRQIFGRRRELIRYFSSLNSLACPSNYIPSLLEECTEAHDEFSLGFDESLNRSFDVDEWRRIKSVLTSRGWNIGSSKTSYIMIDLDESSIVHILNDVFEGSGDAALAFYFFKWSRSKHTIVSICTMIHILVTGNMNYIAMDLIMYLLKRNNEEEHLLLKVLYETHKKREILSIVYSMLIACFVKENKTNEALKLISQIKNLNIFPSNGVCNPLLRALLRSGQMDLAWDLLQEIQSRGFHLNISIISLFIHKYCIIGKLEIGWKLLMETKKYGIKPDVVAYTMLIKSLCENMSLVREATAILFKMVENGIAVDSVSVSAIVDGFCKVGGSDKALTLLNIFNIPPNIYVYNSFISKLCKEGKINEASNAFNEMLELGLQPDCFSYTTVIMGYCKIGEVNSALIVLGKMLKMGIKPSVTTYTTLVEGYCKCEEIHLAGHIFYKMINSGLVPDIVAFNTLMDGYGKKGYLHKAFRVLDMMKSSGFSPDIVTYNILIHSLSVRGFISEANEMIKELTRRGFSPDVLTLTNVISGHAKKGNFEEAYLVWVYLSEQQCMKPDVVTCSALLHGYCKARRMDEADALFCKMLDVGLAPDLVLYNTLVRGFCHIGRVDDACRLINMMVKCGFLPNESTYQALIFGYEKKLYQNPVATATFKLQEILLKYGFTIDVDAYVTSMKQTGN